jgi:hypothetical protein
LFPSAIEAPLRWRRPAKRGRLILNSRQPDRIYIWDQSAIWFFFPDSLFMGGVVHGSFVRESIRSTLNNPDLNHM